MKHTELIKQLESYKSYLLQVSDESEDMDVIHNASIIFDTLEAVITRIKSSNDEFSEWLKSEAKNALTTWAEHSAYMKVLKYFEGIEK